MTVRAAYDSVGEKIELYCDSGGLSELLNAVTEAFAHGQATLSCWADEEARRRDVRGVRHITLIYVNSKPESGKWILTVEYLPNEQALEVFFDKGGLGILTRAIELRRRHGGHDHLKTASWAGTELSEQRQDEASELVHHLYLTFHED
jgi:hypothetical protein